MLCYSLFIGVLKGDPSIVMGVWLLVTNLLYRPPWSIEIG